MSAKTKFPINQLWTGERKLSGIQAKHVFCTGNAFYGERLQNSTGLYLRANLIHSVITRVLCYLPYHRNNRYNDDMENNAVCRGNQHCLYYRLNYKEIQHSPGVGYPSSCKKKIKTRKKSKKKERKSENSSNTRQAERVSTAADTPRRPEENLTKIGAGNLGRNQSRLRLPGPPMGPLITDLNAHRPSNLNKLFWYSFKITKLRLRILPTNMTVLH